MISIGSLMILAALLFVKHLIGDGPLQTSYQVANKGKLFHPAGLTHAGTHVALTALCFLVWGGFALTAENIERCVWVLGLVLSTEFVVHYGVDWLKCRADAWGAWSSLEAGADGQPRLCINSSMFFMVFLADQTAHSLTYVWMLYLVGSCF